MTILWLEEVDSTQRYLKEGVKSKVLQSPICIATRKQSAGQGSRGNSWIGIEGNLFFSFAIARTSLPDDLKLESASIYFMYLLKEELQQRGSMLWLKWPNDFYLEQQKLGGCITMLHNETLLCGIGINVYDAPKGYAKLDITCNIEQLLEAYLQRVEKSVSWKHVFRNYKLEFENNKTRVPLNNSDAFPLNEAWMMDDGSLMCRGQRIYSQR